MKRILISALLLASWAGNAAAQELKFEHVRTYTVKRDRVADWESAVKDLQAFYKKANVVVPTLVYHSLTGPEHFLIIRHYETISKATANRGDAFKGEFAADYRALNIRLFGGVESRSTRVGEIVPDASIVSNAAPAPYIRVTRIQVKTGDRVAMRTMLKQLKDEGMQPAGVKRYSVSETRMGGPIGEFVTKLDVQTLTELDANAWRKAMGEAKFTSYAAKRDALTSEAEVNLYRFRPELSTVSK